jgi:hypothetical protein
MAHLMEVNPGVFKRFDVKAIDEKGLPEEAADDEDGMTTRSRARKRQRGPSGEGVKRM